jgi:hypothetical protein
MALADSELSHCRSLAGNDTQSTGGAIYNQGDLNIVRSRLTHNLASSREISEAYGGAIANLGKLSLSESLLFRNRVQGLSDASGGAISNEGELRLERCTIADNVASAVGVQGYSGAAGGGIYTAGSVGEVWLRNCTLAGNRATHGHVFGSYASGGAIHNYDGEDVELTNCTINGNTAGRPFTYSGYENSGALIGSFVMTNTIVSGSGVSRNCASPLISGGHNLSSDTSCFAPGGTDQVAVRANLAPLGDYGGLTPTMALCSGRAKPYASCQGRSAALDAGDDAVLQTLATDQRGAPRRRGAHVDVGAFEAD